MKFLNQKPVLFLDELPEPTLVLSDLHLGIEYEIYKKGISIPPRMEKQRERILKLVDETKAERLILLGDVKHNVPRMSIGEKENLPKFFEDLKEVVEVEIVKGNHDGNIEKLAEGVKVHDTSGFLEDRFYFNHGHAWPKREVLKARTLIRGHSHPALEFKDRLGFSSVLPCWLRCKVDQGKLEDKIGKVKDSKLEKVLITPAFNHLISGMPVNRSREESLLGPLLEGKIVDLGKSEAYLLDGTFLGAVEEI